MIAIIDRLVLSVNPHEIHSVEEIECISRKRDRAKGVAKGALKGRKVREIDHRMLRIS